MIGDFHIHSRYSIDSLMRPRSILKIARRLGMDTIAITDHNTVRGGVEAKTYEDEFNIRVIIGSELRTDIGDVIGLNIMEDILPSSWRDVVEDIHNQGGMVVLPHPFRGHSQIDTVAPHVDFIEVWNGRCTPDQNQKALDLASSYGIKPIMGSDAHLYPEIGTVMIKFNSSSWSFIEPIRLRSPPKYCQEASQVLSLLRRGRFRELALKGRNRINKL